MSSTTITLAILVIGGYWVFQNWDKVEPMINNLMNQLGMEGGGLGLGTTPITPPAGGAITPATAPGGEIFLNVRINNSQQLGLQFDSGATISIISKDLANVIKLSTANPVRTQNVTTVSGVVAAPVISVTMQIENAAAFQTEIAVMPTSFNLLSRNDLNKVYDITITGGGTKIVPKSAYTMAMASRLRKMYDLHPSMYYI